MPLFNQLSIRCKLLVLLGLSLGLGLLVSSLVALYSTFAAERQSSLRALLQTAAITSENMRAALAFHDAHSAAKILLPLHTNPHIRYAFVQDKAGELLGAYQAADTSAASAAAWRADITRRAALPDSQAEGGADSGLRQGMENTYHFVWYPIALEGQRIGALALLADNEAMYSKMRRFMLLQGGASALILAGLLLLSWRLQLIFTRPIERLLANMRRIGQDKDYTAVLRTRRRDEFGELYQGFNAMLQEIRQRDEQLSHLASTDALTGLANRGHVQAVLQAMVLRAQRTQEAIGMILLDIDHFKQVNDQHGHPAGDQVLRELAQIVQASIRAYDLAARFGGEEFIVLCDGADLASTADVAERIRASVAGHAFVLPQGQTLALTVSLGVHVAQVAQVAQASHQAHDAEAATQQLAALIAAADQALYRAKQAGRNRIEYA